MTYKLLQIQKKEAKSQGTSRSGKSSNDASASVRA